MKKIRIFGLCLLLIATTVPILAVIGKFPTEKNTEKATEQPEVSSISEATISKAEPSTKDEVTIDKEIVVSKAIDYLREDFTKECKLAVLEICKNNYIYYIKSGEEIPQIRIENFSDKLYEELNLLYETLEFELTYKGETVYIPLIKSSHLKTSTCDEYPYMVSVASPWEYLSDGFMYNKAAPCGISVYGLEYIAQEGLSKEELLSYYLPNFEIKRLQPSA